MGFSIKFYAADPAVFVAINQRMSAAQSFDEVSRIYDEISGYSHADFSLNLTIPDHLDALCQAMIAEGFAVPPDLLGTPLWYDNSGSIHQLPPAFPLALAQASETSIKRIAERWVTSFLRNDEPAEAAIVLHYAFTAIADLCTISSYALERHQSLMLRFVL